jgi:hypothetical protein
MSSETSPFRRNAADIIGIGVQKAATSWAAHVLNLHPKVWFPSEVAHKGKEVRFFDTKNWQQGPAWYRQVMTPPDSTLLSADVSPGYSRIARPRVRTCLDIAPEARLFLLLRSPVFRDWSSLLMDANRSGFDVANASFVDLMVFYDHQNIQQFTTYARTLRIWQEFYREKLLVLFYDDLVRDPASIFTELCTHVGIDPEDVPEWRSKVKSTIFKGPEIPLREDMAEFLAKKYRPMVEQLEPMVERDLSSWLDPMSLAGERAASPVDVAEQDHAVG